MSLVLEVLRDKTRDGRPRHRWLVLGSHGFAHLLRQQVVHDIDRIGLTKPMCPSPSHSNLMKDSSGTKFMVEVEVNFKSSRSGGYGPFPRLRSIQKQKFPAR